MMIRKYIYSTAVLLLLLGGCTLQHQPNNLSATPNNIHSVSTCSTTGKCAIAGSGEININKKAQKAKSEERTEKKTVKNETGVNTLVYEKKQINQIAHNIGLSELEQTLKKNMEQLNKVKNNDKQLELLTETILQNISKTTKTTNIANDKVFKEIVKDNLKNYINNTLDTLNNDYFKLEQLKKELIYLKKDDVSKAYKENILDNINKEKEKIIKDTEKLRINPSNIAEDIKHSLEVRKKAQKILNPENTLDIVIKETKENAFKGPVDNNLLNKINSFIKEKVNQYKSVKVDEMAYRKFMNICNDVQKGEAKIYVYNHNMYVEYNGKLYSNVLTLCKLNILSNKLLGIRLPVQFRKTGEKLGGYDIYAVGGPLIRGIENTVSLYLMSKYNPAIFKLYNPLNAGDTIGKSPQDIINDYAGF